ncbi:hypothetical protein AVEN_265476-1 [Araneus ventricosus]|uniref:Uncharacterized protein n=1 Tax=Araneus ventricosus TaxID=182803 RepID=A0A4Y2CI67_ARAVE|nr:hypothetical protein AVEN_265476-1 [Araneus ventricosus]
MYIGNPTIGNPTIFMYIGNLMIFMYIGNLMIFMYIGNSTIGNPTIFMYIGNPTIGNPTTPGESVDVGHGRLNSMLPHTGRSRAAPHLSTTLKIFRICIHFNLIMLR